MEKSEALVLVADWIIEEWERGGLKLRLAGSILQRICWQNDYDRKLLSIYCVTKYVEAGCATEQDLIKEFEKFKVRDFQKYFIDPAQIPSNVTVADDSFLGKIRRLFKYLKAG